MIQNITIWPYLISWNETLSPSAIPNISAHNRSPGTVSSYVQNTKEKNLCTTYYVNPQTYTIHAGFRYIDTALQFRSIACSALLNKIITCAHLCLTLAEWQGKLAENLNTPSQIEQFLSMAIHCELLLPYQKDSSEITPSHTQTFLKVEKWDNPKLCTDIITLINKLSALQGNNSMLAFCQHAKDHFGDKMIPLTTLLDPIFGLGYPLQKKELHEQAQMLFSQSIHRVESEIFSSIIYNTLDRAKKTNTVHLTNNSMIDLENNNDALPQVFALRVTTCCDKGKKKYLLNYTLPAGKLLEIILSTPKILASQEAKVTLEKIQAQFQKTYNTELLFSPLQSSIERAFSCKKNIVSIYPNFDSSGTIIFPNDLYFSVNNVESGIYAYSKKIFLTPYVPSIPSNTEFQGAFCSFFQDIYQLLNPLPVLSCYKLNKKTVFFPRVEYNNLILFPKTWIFNTAWIFHSNANNTDSIMQLQGLFRLYSVPQHIIFHDSNNDVLISITDPSDLLRTIQTIRRRLSFVFCEALGSMKSSHHQIKNDFRTEYLIIYKEGSN